jgi:phosphoethanolamine N-methyltransferase
MTSAEAATPASAAERYTRRAALRHERMYGRGYQGPGSEKVFTALASRLDLRPGMRLLDVGSGLGGDSFRLAQRYGLIVLGLDAAADMTAICVERAEEAQVEGVSFVTGDVRSADLEAGSFDVVWTRDCGLYVPPADKPRMWERLNQVLRPSGQVLLTDYGRGPSPSSPAFDEHSAATGQFPITMSEYAAIFDSAGFCSIVVDDRTEDLQNSMVEERRRLIGDEAGFLADFTHEEYDGLIERWDKKIQWCQRGELAWIVISARRPAL